MPIDEFTQEMPPQNNFILPQGATSKRGNLGLMGERPGILFQFL